MTKSGDFNDKPETLYRPAMFKARAERLAKLYSVCALIPAAQADNSLSSEFIPLHLIVLSDGSVKRAVIVCMSSAVDTRTGDPHCGDPGLSSA